MWCHFFNMLILRKKKKTLTWINTHDLCILGIASTVPTLRLDLDLQNSEWNTERMVDYKSMRMSMFPLLQQTQALPQPLGQQGERRV